MRPTGMEPWQMHGRRRLRGVSAAMPRGAALIAGLAVPLPAVAQDNVLATATLPRDLSPWGMYLNADPVVKAVCQCAAGKNPSRTSPDRDRQIGHCNLMMLHCNTWPTAY